VGLAAWIGFWPTTSSSIRSCGCRRHESGEPIGMSKIDALRDSGLLGTADETPRRRKEREIWGEGGWGRCNGATRAV
jgi:hypothetical protein